MKTIRTVCLSLSAAVALMVAPLAHAKALDDDQARASIMAPVQAAHAFYTVESQRVDNALDVIAAELADSAALTAERKNVLDVAVNALRIRQASAIDRLLAEAAVAQLKMADWNAGR